MCTGTSNMQFLVVLTTVLMTVVLVTPEECVDFMLNSKYRIPNDFQEKVQSPTVRMMAANMVCKKFAQLESNHPGLSCVDWMKKNDGIFPGTYWCGYGNSTSDPSKLGIFNETDACCREHDQCKENYAVGECKQGFCNNESYTVSECGCDDSFYSCLKRCKEDAAFMVGYVCFDFMCMKCFRYTHPTLGCKEKQPTGCCKEYIYDNNATKIIQMFCNPSFVEN